MSKDANRCKDVYAALDVDRVLRLRLEHGLTWKEIGDRFGALSAMVCAHVKRRLGYLPRPSADVKVKLSNLR